jgi:hypothetical protein
MWSSRLRDAASATQTWALHSTAFQPATPCRLSWGMKYLDVSLLLEKMLRNGLAGR